MSDNSTELSTITITKPLLKWVGGKTQIIRDVLQLFPRRMKNYHEPFLGGGSVLLGLLSCIKYGAIHVSGNIYASDANRLLIGLYKNIQTKPDELYNEIKKIIDVYFQCKGTIVNRKPTCIEEAKTSQESYYYWIRSCLNSIHDDDKLTPYASAMFLFLNKTCFRGVYREGPHGFNVPFGNYKNPTIIDKTHIYEISELFRNVVFSCCSYRNSLTSVKRDDFVYMDPPYAPENDKSFVSYTSAGFKLDDHTRLFDMCNDIHRTGAKLLMSNADVKLVTDSFQVSEYNTSRIVCRRAINSKNPESKTSEVLIKNY
jgi:DNA adenine methylase